MRKFIIKYIQGSAVELAVPLQNGIRELRLNDEVEVSEYDYCRLMPTGDFIGRIEEEAPIKTKVVEAEKVEEKTNAVENNDKVDDEAPKAKSVK